MVSLTRALRDALNCEGLAVVLARAVTWQGRVLHGAAGPPARQTDRRLHYQIARNKLEQGLQYLNIGFKEKGT